MNRVQKVAVALALMAIGSSPVLAQKSAGERGWSGPGRYCGMGPIVDMNAGERIVTESAGFHSGSFKWSGRFGTMRVHGIAWASKPEGRALARRTSKGHILFAERRDKRGYTVALWNGDHGAAYFSSRRPLTPAQLAAIDRVDLFNEGEEPQGCTFRVIVVLD